MNGTCLVFIFFLTHHVRLVKTRFWTWCKKGSAIIATKVVTPINQNALMWQVSIYASLLPSLFPSSFHWEGSLLKQSEGASQGFVGIVDIILWTNFMNEENASLFLLQLSVIFILRIPFHQIADTWCALIKSFLWRFQYPLSPGPNLTSWKHFLCQVCRVEGPVFLVMVLSLYIGICRDGHFLVWSPQLPVPHWAPSSLTTSPFYIHFFSSAASSSLFGKQKYLALSLAL